jgi:hypothetical protein
MGAEASADYVSHGLSRVALAVVGSTVRRKVLCFRDAEREPDSEQEPSDAIERVWSEEVSE